MKFCNLCNNMLYIHSSTDESGLSYACRNCDFKVDDPNPKRCVYENIYNENNRTNEILFNKYTRYDPTLPRVNTIKCINDNCISNKTDLAEVLIMTDLSLYMNSMPIKDNIAKKLEGISSFELVDLDEENLLINLHDKSKIFDARVVLSQIHTHVDYHKKIDSKIIFIQYNRNDMRYVYICDYCNSSWKK